MTTHRINSLMRTIFLFQRHKICDMYNLFSETSLVDDFYWQKLETIVTLPGQGQF